MPACKKHDLEYADYLNECPICAGEKMVPIAWVKQGLINVPVYSEEAVKSQQKLEEAWSEKSVERKEPRVKKNQSKPLVKKKRRKRPVG